MTASQPVSGPVPGGDLAALSEAATEGHWYALDRDAMFNPSVGIRDEPPSMLTPEQWVAECGPDGHANTRFIVALVNAFRGGRLIPASEVEALADDYDDRNVWVGWDVPHTVDGYRSFNKRASDDLRAVLARAAGGVS